jgi:hypothetical protein
MSIPLHFWSDGGDILGLFKNCSSTDADVPAACTLIMPVMSVEEYSAFLTFMYKNFVLYYDTADCD